MKLISIGKGTKHNFSSFYPVNELHVGCRLKRLAGKRTVHINGEATRLGTSHNMLSQLQSGPLTFCSHGKKIKNVLHIYIYILSMDNLFSVLLTLLSSKKEHCIQV